ncbi:MAG: T9SS type A sorting domain-containing protein [Flavobacteriales bacterium]|nr:T9SS type A sorting domain-containing protein [Flavobacteriales bacterium]
MLHRCSNKIFIHSIVLLLVVFNGLPVFGQTACNLSNFTSAYILNANDYPYTSAGSGITVSATWPGVSTLSNFSYSCNGQVFNTAAPAWWLNNASQVITLTFSAPVTSFSVVVNGTNNTEEFYFAANSGTVSLSNYCTVGWTAINGGTGLRYNTTTTTGNLITVNHPTGETVFTMTHNGLGSGSRYAVLDCFVPAVLPIKLLSFDASCNKDRVELSWITETEIDNAFFTVERSSNGIDFEAIATMPGAGNSSELIHYSWTDFTPIDGMAYYRLKQTDYSGTFTYSDLKSASCSNRGDVSIYPNPAEDKLFVRSETQYTSIVITDISGKTVKAVPGSQQEIDVSKLSKGIYFIQLNGRETVTKKFIMK